MSVRLVVAGGGSGGHIYPALSVIEHLCDRGVISRDEVLWLCSKNESDKQILSGNRISYEAIPSGKLRRYFSLKNAEDIFRCFAGFIRSLKLLSSKRPQCVFSKGGYVSVPAAYAAALLGIPVVSHESDIDPGLSTRINQRASRRICVPFEASRRYYRNPDQVVVTGNPVTRKPAGGDGSLPVEVPDHLPCILIHGGSLGSYSLNTVVWELLEGLPEGISVVHVTGRGERRSPPAREGYYPVDYLEGGFHRMLKRSDLVISRAGAGSLWEQAAAGKAMILLPLGRRISRGEQERNARYFAEHDAALCFYDDAIDTQRVIRDILRLLQEPDRRRELSENAASLIHDKGSERIAEVLQEYLVSGE